MRRLAISTAFHLAVFVAAGVSGWREVGIPPPPRPPDFSFWFAFEIARHNVQSLLLMVSGNVCSFGAAGVLLMIINGLVFSIPVGVLGPSVWLFVVLEILSFCAAGGAAQCLSFSLGRWASGKPVALCAEFRRVVLVVCASCLGLIMAAILETAVLAYVLPAADGG